MYIYIIKIGSPNLHKLAVVIARTLGENPIQPNITHRLTQLSVAPPGVPLSRIGEAFPSYGGLPQDSLPTNMLHLRPVATFQRGERAESEDGTMVRQDQSCACFRWLQNAEND